MINFNDFLIFAAIIALLSIIVGVFFGVSRRKAIERV
jgi:hypothetical protein